MAGPAGAGGDVAVGILVTEGPHVLALGGGQVLLRGLAVVDAARLVEVAADLMRRRDGIAPPPRLQVLRRALRVEAAAVAVRGHADVRSSAELAESAVGSAADTLTTTAAAAVLGLSERQVRRLAGDLGGHRAGRAWLFDSDTVAAVAAQRRRHGAG